MELLLILLGTLGLGLGMASFSPETAADDPTPTPQDDTDRAISSGDTYGGPDDNTLRVDGDATAHGGAGFDTIWASEESTAYGGAGQDSMVLSGNASGYGGWGDDTLTASGTSEVFGGVANDVLTVGEDATGYGGSGNDTLNAAGAAWGDDGNDVFNIDISLGTTVGIYGGAGNDTMTGYEDNFRINQPHDGPSTLYGGAGDDSIDVEGSGILAYGDDGSDTLEGAYDSSQLLYGGNGNDVISGGFRNYGGDGDDSINAYDAFGYGEGGNDVIVAKFAYGGAGDDVLTAEPLIGEGGVIDNSEVYGGDGNDTLWGYGLATYEFGPAMVLSGGADNDVIHSVGGDNVDAGAGNDTVFATTQDYAVTSNITLGEGADSLVMALAPEDGDIGEEDLGIVEVQDFNPASDHLALIIAPSNLAALQITITPNALGGNTVVTITAPDSSVATYDFKGITNLDASAIKLYADKTAVLAGTSYGNLA